MQHPIDRLHAIRQQIKALRREQQEIKIELMAGRVNAIGERFIAECTTHVRLHPRELTQTLPGWRT